MSNDVLTAIPLFLFMGYIVERANIVDRLFTHAEHRREATSPARMAVAALVTCTLFATATGIVGAVVTLMGLLALPAMLKARYDTRFATGIICAGGTLGILIPPSIMLIVYAATSGVSIVRLYAGGAAAGLPARRPLSRLRRSAARCCSRSVAPKPTARRMPDVTARPARRWMMLTSFVPLAFLILAVLGAILFGLATPSEAAAIGALGGLVLAVAYRALTWQRLREVGLSDGAHHGDGVLAVRRLGDLRLGLRLSRRRAADRRVRHRARPVAADVPDPGAAHHLPPRLAAGMDGDHHHLRADLPAAAAAFRHRSAVLRHPGRAQPADRVPVAADGDVGLLPQGHRAAARHAQRRSSRAACRSC